MTCVCIYELPLLKPRTSALVAGMCRSHRIRVCHDRYGRVRIPAIQKESW